MRPCQRLSLALLLADVVLAGAAAGGSTSPCRFLGSGAAARPIVTDLAVIEPTLDGLVLRERAPGVSVEEILEATAARLIVPAHVPEMDIRTPAVA